MWMQTVNRSDNERVWVNFTNTDGQTITAYSPVSKMFWTNAKSLSVVLMRGMLCPLILKLQLVALPSKIS